MNLNRLMTDWTQFSSSLGRVSHFLGPKVEKRDPRGFNLACVADFFTIVALILHPSRMESNKCILLLKLAHDNKTRSRLIPRGFWVREIGSLLRNLYLEVVVLF